MKKITGLNRIRGRKGFTLVEMNVGFVVMLILVAAVMSLILIGFNLYSTQAAQENAQIVGDGVYRVIDQKIQFNKNITIKQGVGFSAPPEYEANKISNVNFLVLGSDGKSLKVGNDSELTNVFPQHFFDGLAVKVIISPVETTGTQALPLNVVIEVHSNSLSGNVLYTRNATVGVLNEKISKISAQLSAPVENGDGYGLYIIYS